MAGQAPATSDSRMPVSSPSVSSAAALASQPNSASAQAPVREGRAAEGVISRAWPLTAKSKRISWAGSVEDIGHPSVTPRPGLSAFYLYAIGLPDASLISPQAFSIWAFTTFGIGT
jgi:hypothetical protein